MSKPLAGILSLDLGGRAVTVGASLTYQPNTTTREGKNGQSGKGGFVEKPVIAWIEGELLNDDPAINKYLHEFTGDDVQLDMPNGESYIYVNAWTAGEFTGDAVEGSRSFRIETTEVEDQSA